MLRTLKRVGYVVGMLCAIAGGIALLAAITVSPFFLVKWFAGEQVLDWVVGVFLVAFLVWLIGGAAWDLWKHSTRVIPRTNGSDKAD
jgi:hypothetical protein